MTGRRTIFTFVTTVTMLPGLLLARERLLPGGQYRDQPLRSIRPTLATMVSLGFIHVGSLTAGAVGWCVATIAMELQPVASLTAALSAVLSGGALGTMMAMVWGESMWHRLAGE